MSLSYLPPRASILDVGCGTGNPVAMTLAAADHHVTGTDISKEMVRLSRKSVPQGMFEVVNMQKWTPPDGVALDAVFVILSLFALSRGD